MKSFTNSNKCLAKWLSVCLAAISLFLCPATQLRAEEPAERYLEALRERGLFRVALHYLDGAEKSKSVPADFRKRVLFEKAQLLIDSVTETRDSEEISKRLDEADKLLTNYAKKVSDPLKSTEVKKIQANVRYFRGRNYLKQAESEKTPEKRKKEYFAQANKLLGDAIPTYREVQKAQASQVDDFVIDPQYQKESDKALQKLQTSYVDTRLKIPVAMEKYALSFNDKEKERKAKLVEAGKEFEAVAKKYEERFLQGQMARAFAAKCYQLAGKHDASFKQLKLVFEYRGAPKPLVQEGLVAGVETWPKIKPYPHDEVIKAAEKPISLLNRRDKANPTWLRIQLELARAKQKKSAAVKEKDPSQSKRLMSEATKLAREVARRRNPHSEMASKILGEWGVSVKPAPGEEVEVADTNPPKTFAEAKQRAAEMIQPLSEQVSEFSTAKRKFDKLQGKGTAEQEAEIQQLEDDLYGQADEALRILSQAVAFADKDTPRADLNNVRYLQSYCHFAKGRYANSAVIGRFLMEKYPTIDWSRQASALMINSYVKIFDTNTGLKRDLARDKIIEAASAVSARWAGSNESASAAVAATRVAVVDGDFDAASQFFSKIPANSPNRGPLAAKIGNQIWAKRNSAKSNEEKMKIALSAKEFLGAAVENADPATMSASIGVSAIYFIDANRESGDIDEAVKRSDELLKSLDKNKAFGKNNRIRQAVYNTSLSTYLAALGNKGKAQQWIDKSKSVIQKMATEAAGDPRAEASVSAVYRRVAGDLEDKFESLPNLKEKQQFATSLKSFFAAIGSGAKDAKTRLWAGEALLGIAESLKTSGANEKGKDLAAEAISLLESAKQAGFGDDQRLQLNYQVQLALAQRSSGDFEASIKSFETILTKTKALNIQIDAAKTLLMWGIDKENGNALSQALSGRTDYKDAQGRPRKRIWGFKAMSGMTRSDEKFREAFRECTYYAVLCRLRYGEIKDNKKAIEIAKKDFDRAMQRFDDLAVGQWKNKYDRLLKDLESALK